MKKTILFFWLIVIIHFFLFKPNFNIYSQEMPSVKTIVTTKITSEVLKVSNHTITIQTTEGVKEIDIPSNIKITLNGKSTDIKKIKPQDRVEILLTDSGQVLSVSITSTRGKNLTNIIVPTIIITLVAFFIASSTIQKNGRKQYIKTTTD